MTQTMLPIVGKVIQQETTDPNPECLVRQLCELISGDNNFVDCSGKAKNNKALEAA